MCAVIHKTAITNNLNTRITQKQSLPEVATNQLASGGVCSGRLTVNEMMSGDRNTAIGNTPSGDSNSLTFTQQTKTF